ncbi:DUF6691 family protein [Variovorax terrae]|uniref:YeeE/YedE family protein n=1 Tax=Variovorax terrae TaxID=2923278 RepID=A0A9X1VX40_9BURK|nr:DUF6691 family protein [Variovorax terrae]MCJ0764848.1 YeeE/YedE family protein [Variovorax terrae]
MIQKLLLALVSGALFAVGLVLSGMTQPAKVIGFLNVGGLVDPARFGAWDPSLAFVMGGALCVTLVAFAVTPRPGRKPWRAATFQLPTRRGVDRRLVFGAALFGIGWGLAGYCPGPALASLLTGGLDALLFVAAMAAGMALARRLAGGAARP